MWIGAAVVTGTVATGLAGAGRTTTGGAVLVGAGTVVAAVVAVVEVEAGLAAVVMGAAETAVLGVGGAEVPAPGAAGRPAPPGWDRPAAATRRPDVGAELPVARSRSRGAPSTAPLRARLRALLVPCPGRSDWTPRGSASEASGTRIGTGAGGAGTGCWGGSRSGTATLGTDSSGGRGGCTTRRAWGSPPGPDHSSGARSRGCSSRSRRCAGRTAREARTAPAR